MLSTSLVRELVCPDERAEVTGLDCFGAITSCKGSFKLKDSFPVGAVVAGAGAETAGAFFDAGSSSSPESESIEASFAFNAAIRAFSAASCTKHEERTGRNGDTKHEEGQAGI